jgi:PAS domain S-box-containing protein
MYKKPGKKEIDANLTKAELLDELYALDEKYNIILDAMDVTMTLVDAETLERKDGNLHFAELLGYSLEELHDLSPKELLVDIENNGMHQAHEEVKASGSSVYTTQFRKKDGSILDLSMTSKLVEINAEACILSSGRDITELLRAQNDRERAYEELEQKVRERTRELSLKTEKLEQEILKREAVEQELRKSQDELNLKNSSLEDMNTALKILLGKTAEDRSETEKNLVVNIRELIEPYLEQIKKTQLTPDQRSLLNVVESNLKEVVAPHLHRMFDDKFSIFTPREIQVANLVKVGKSTKKIAQLLHMGSGTVEHHRKNIRKKLGLNNRGANLRSYLLSKTDLPGMKHP